MVNVLLTYSPHLIVYLSFVLLLTLLFNFPPGGYQ